jgi:DNA-binding transcriptional MocR family regulator
VVRAKARTDAGPSVPAQLILTRLLERHEAIVDRRRAFVNAARTTATRVLRSDLPLWQVEGSPCGPTMWIRLPLRDTASFVEYAFAQGLEIGYGGDWRADGGRSAHIRLSLTSGPAEITGLLNRLAEIWRDFCSARPGPKLVP